MNILEEIISCLQGVCKQKQRVHSSKKLLSLNNLFSSEYVYLPVRGMGRLNWQIFVLCFETVVWKAVWKRSIIVMVSRVIIPSVVCVNAAFFQGCIKKGRSGCFATRACGERLRKMSLLPKAPRHPGCVCPACRAGPTHPPPSLQAPRVEAAEHRLPWGHYGPWVPRQSCVCFSWCWMWPLFYQKGISIVF